MKCMHPYCPMGDGAANWGDVVDADALKARPADRSALAGNLSSFGAPSAPSILLAPPTSNSALLTRLLTLCPCLYNQLDVRCSPKGIVHLCELTMAARITSANVVGAFDIQHPRKTPDFLYGLGQEGADAGSIMEALCSEVLDNEGIPAMDLDRNNWPVWRMPGHIMLNAGKMRAVKAFGDILIPAGPANIIISVKTQAARERLLYSANMIEGVGFGFFDEPSEFWSQSRMNLFKRMGFTAIYLPDSTYTALTAHIVRSHLESFAVNINGKELYRPLSRFGADMRSIVGRTTLDL